MVGNYTALTKWITCVDGNISLFYQVSALSGIYSWAYIGLRAMNNLDTMKVSSHPHHHHQEKTRVSSTALNNQITYFWETQWWYRLVVQLKPVERERELVTKDKNIVDE